MAEVKRRVLRGRIVRRPGKRECAATPEEIAAWLVDVDA